MKYYKIDLKILKLIDLIYWMQKECNLTIYSFDNLANMDVKELETVKDQFITIYNNNSINK